MRDMIKRRTREITRRGGVPLLVLFISIVIPQTTVLAQIPHIVSTSPEQNELNVPVDTNISVTFDVDMNPLTINETSFIVNARSTGLHQGTITYDSQTKTATSDPLEDFDEGEAVTVVLTTDIQSSEGTPLDSSYAWSFTIIVMDGSGIFTPDSVYPVGDWPRSVFAADLDGDEDLDLATANVGPDNVSVLLNNGDGTFAPDSVYPVGAYPSSVFAADLDGDGDLDLATANWSSSNNVSVLLNNGDGTFAPDSVYPVGYEPRSVFAADLDGDEDLDLATANFNSDNVSVLLNNGDGTFALHSVYPVGDGPWSVFAADLDGDADLDLATANWYSDDVSILINREFICGDVNNDWVINLGDVIYLANYLLKGGPEPACPPAPYSACADVNGDCLLNLGDVIYLANYLLKSGPAPHCDCGGALGN